MRASAYILSADPTCLLLLALGKAVTLLALAPVSTTVEHIVLEEFASALSSEPSGTRGKVMRASAWEAAPGAPAQQLVPVAVVNYCADPALNNCDRNARCSNSFSKFVCTCNPGYQGPGTTCTGDGNTVCL